MPKRSLNLAFYVSGRATRFRKILKKGESDIRKSTKLVISDSSSNEDLGEELDELGIFFQCFDYNDLEGDNNLVLSDLLLKQFNKHNIDYCFCFGDHILKGELLSIYKNKIINFHPSLLPSYKGRMAIDQAIANGAALLGNTAHFLTDKVDGGQIILQNVLHASIFRQGGYDAILDNQIIMADQIFRWLQQNRIKICKEQVIVKDADYSGVKYFPEIET